MFGTDVYSSNEVVALDQTLLDERLQEITDAIKDYNNVVIAQNSRDADGNYATINMTSILLNMTYQPYEGDNINKVAGKIANCSATTITLIVVHMQTSSEGQKIRFVKMLKEYQSKKFLTNALGQTIIRCSTETIIEESRVLLYAPYPPNAPPFPFIDEDVLFAVGMTTTAVAASALLFCVLSGHMVLAAFRQTADLADIQPRNAKKENSSPDPSAAAK